MADNKHRVLTDEEFLKTIPRIKKLLQGRAAAAKKRSDRHPKNMRFAQEHLDASVELNAFMQCLDICGSLAKTAQELVISAKNLSEQLNFQRNPGDKKDLN